MKTRSDIENQAWLEFGQQIEMHERHTDPSHRANLLEAAFRIVWKARGKADTAAIMGLPLDDRSNHASFAIANQDEQP